MPFLRILSSLLLFCSSLGLVHAIPRPSPSTSQGECNAPWVELGVEIFDHLPKSEGVDYCTSLLGRGTVTSTTTLQVPTTITQTSIMDVVTTLSTPLTTETSTFIIPFTTIIDSTTTFVINEVTTLPTSSTTAIQTNKITSSTTLTTYTYTSTTSTTTFATQFSPALAYGKRSVSNNERRDLANVLGIAESLVTEFCSCVATAPIPTSTITETVHPTSTATTYITSITATATPAVSYITQVVSSTTTILSTVVNTIDVTSVTSTVTPDVATISTSTTVVQTKTIDAVASTTQVVVSSVIQEFALQTSGVGCVGAQNLITLATLGSEDTDTAIQECATVCLETAGCLSIDVLKSNPADDNGNTAIYCAIFSTPYQSSYLQIGCTGNPSFWFYNLETIG
ncbi:hypothetical protein NA56DRAFT_703809 [Hyaloscypha hepaticicola]|uniref:Apple domain-containing protein n=1 Tax=Hyaloscypha hepaticicola TaxID=2082293 RepID=A0A2J6Q4A6_9HELO|nr:hypothetical protein NA56DRAFT_703809 [Hyaloscypha hepaticicola]